MAGARRFVAPVAAGILAVFTVVTSLAAQTPATIPPGGPDNSDVRFTVGEASLLNWLQAATPFSVTVGAQVLSADLVLTDPSDLKLKDGKASFKIRVKGKTLPIDQVVSPEITLVYDKALAKYFGVLSSLPLTLPGLGSIDLKDYASRFEIPSLLENLWRFADKPVGLNLKIRRIAVVDHALELGGEVHFAPLAPAGTRSAR